MASGSNNDWHVHEYDVHEYFRQYEFHEYFRQYEYHGRARARTFNEYLASFNGCKEKFQHIRVVFTGREAVGKTTICRRLQDKDVDLASRTPTIGADVHQNWLAIDWETKQWYPNGDKSAAEVLKTRLGSAIKKTQTTGGGFFSGMFENGAIPTQQVTPEVMAEISDVQQASERAGSNVAFLSLWDMGGHLPFQATHNVFISSHGIYLLVFRLTDFINDKRETDRLKKWIRMIGTFSAVECNAPKLKEHPPPLIFVGTFLDELKKTFADFDERIDAIMSSISKFPELSPYKFAKFCTLDNTLGTDPDDRNLEKLRILITNLAEHQDQWGRELPAKWLQLEMDLLKKRKQGIRVLTLKEVKEMNLKSIAPLDDEEEIKIALEYLHCTRSVIYFREIDSIIIDPQFLIDFFSLLITDNQFLPKDDLKLFRDLKLYQKRGELTPALINYLLGHDKTKDFLPHKSNLLALMEKFGLIVRMQLPESTTENVRFSETYTVPNKLVELQNISSITECVKDLAISKTLCFFFKDVFVPEELFCRVFATIMRTFKASPLSKHSLEEEHGRNAVTTKDKTCLFRAFGCFHINDIYSMILSMHWERSTITVTLFSPTQQQPLPAPGSSVRKRMEEIIQETLQISRQQHFEYTFKLHCNFYLNPYDTPLDLDSVNNAKEGLACKGDYCRGKHRLNQSDLLFWDIIKACAPTRPITFDGEEARLDRRPTPRELGRLSYVVEAAQCSSLFVPLGLSMADISNMLHGTRNLGVETQITRMFLMWTCSYPNHTFRHIQKAMKEAEMNWDNLGVVLETGWESVSLDEMESDEELHRPLAISETAGILSHIGKKYFNLFLELGLSVSAIEKCEIDNPTAESRFEALIQLWINTFQDQATIIRVLKAMKVCKMDWYATALKYSGDDHVAKKRKASVPVCETSEKFKKAARN